MPRASRSEGPRRSVLRLVGVILLTLPWLVPVDFVVVEGAAAAAYLAGLAAGCLVVVFSSRYGDDRWRLLAILFVLVLLSSLAGPDGLAGSVVLGARIVSGFALALLLRRPSMWVWTVLIADVLALAVDYAMNRYVYLEALGALRFPMQIGGEVRPRGFIGQPVPAAMLAMACAIFLIMVAVHERRARNGLAALALAAAVMLLSGTRSSIVVMVLVLILFGVRQLVRGRVTVGRLVQMLVVGIPAAILIYWIVPLTPLYRRADLLTSDSYLVRSSGLETLQGLPDDCPPCMFIGHGYGGLQRMLGQGYATGNVNTVDNQFLTAYWDFGLLGVLALLALFVWSCMTMIRAANGLRAAAAAAIVTLLVAGLFYDVLWSLHGAMLFGFFLSLIKRVEEPGLSHQSALKHDTIRGRDVDRGAPSSRRRSHSRSRVRRVRQGSSVA